MKKKIRVYLRAFEIADHIKIHQWRQDKEIARNFGGVPLFSSSENEKKWIEEKIFDKNNVSCAICLKENDEFIGCVFLTTIDYHNRSARGGLFIGEKKHLSKGYGTEARLLMLKYAFFARGLERVWAIVLEDNLAAIKMHEKTGYKKEGILRKARFKEGRFINAIPMAVLKEDFVKYLEDHEL